MSEKTRKYLSWLPIAGALIACGFLFNTARVAEEEHSVAHTQAAIFHTLLYGSHQPMVILGPDGKILEWNPAATEMFGWTEDEVVGKTPEFLMADKSDWEKHCSRLRAREEISLLRETHVIRGIAITKNGEKLPLNIIARVVRNGSGPYFVAVFTKPDDLFIHPGVKGAAELK